MAYTNSPLVTYTKLSPNHSGHRPHHAALRSWSVQCGNAGKHLRADQQTGFLQLRHWC